MDMPEGTDANGDLARHSNGLVDASVQPPPPVIDTMGTKIEVTQGQMPKRFAGFNDYNSNAKASSIPKSKPTQPTQPGRGIPAPGRGQGDPL